MKVNFLDKEKRIVSVEISFKDKVYFMGRMGLCSGDIMRQIEPATLSQEALVNLWKNYDSKSISKEVERKIANVAKFIRLKIFEDECELMDSGFRGREFWKYLYDEVESFDRDEELCRRVQAVFDAMDWAYPFAEEVELKEHMFSYLEIGERLICCDRIEYMKSVAIQYLKENWKPQWKAAVKNDATVLGFEDWCERLCINDAWTEVLDREDGVGKKIEVGGIIYWVGR